MKLQVKVDRVEFLKPYSYFILLKTTEQSLRTDISEFSENPHFINNTLLMDQPNNIQLSACIVLDYAGKKDKAGQTLVLGRCELPLSEYQSTLSDPAGYKSQKEFIQQSPNGKLTVGHFVVSISRHQAEPTSDYLDQIEQFKIVEEEEEGELGDCCIRIDLHAGTDFPPDSGFYIQASWSNKYKSAFPRYVQSSRMIQNDMNPLWQEQLLLPLNKKLLNGFVNLVVRDKDNNILQHVSFELLKLLPFLHYHIELPLREELKALRPSVFFSMLLQNAPQKNLTEQICKLAVSRIEVVPQMPPSRKIFIVLSNQKIERVKFIRMDGMHEQQLVELWKLQKNRFSLSPILTTPIDKGYQMHFLKSNLIKLNFLSVLSWQKNHKFKNDIFSLVAQSSNCTSTLKDVFYDQEKSAVVATTSQSGKQQFGEIKFIIELFSQEAPKQQEAHESLHISDPLHQRWKEISNELHIRQKLLHSMRKQIDQRTNNITKKGDAIECLRRAERDLLKRSKFLEGRLNREQLIQVSSGILDEKINLPQLYRTLTTLSQQLSEIILQNEEAMVRIDTFSPVEHPQIEQLQKQYNRNVRLLSEMQQRVEKVPFYTQILKRQKQSILRLEKAFEDSQKDKQMNDILQQELKKLKKSNVSEEKPMDMEEHRLNRILDHIVKQKGGKGDQKHDKVNKLKVEILNVEDELRRKSEYYARTMVKRDY